jgi:hypothetical protein
MKYQVPAAESPASKPTPIVLATELGSTAQMLVDRADRPTNARVPVGLADKEKRATRQNPPSLVAFPLQHIVVALTSPPTALALVVLVQRVRRLCV